MSNVIFAKTTRKVLFDPENKQGLPLMEAQDWQRGRLVGEPSDGVVEIMVHIYIYIYTHMIIKRKLTSYDIIYSYRSLCMYVYIYIYMYVYIYIYV